MTVAEIEKELEPLLAKRARLKKSRQIARIEKRWDDAEMIHGELRELAHEINLLQQKRWFQNSERKRNHRHHSDSFIRVVFGKCKKDMTREEMVEYNKLLLFRRKYVRHTED